MNPILHNLKQLTILALLVSSPAFSGVAGVIHHCTLTQTSMDCCGSASSAHQDICFSIVPPTTGVAFASVFSCHTNTIVGGVAVRPAILKSIDPAGSLKLEILVQAIIDPAVDGDFASHELAFNEKALPPPAVNSYILHSSLLI